MRSAIVKGDAVLNLIPQRPPIVMIDSLLDADDTFALTGLTIHENNIFVEEGVLKEPGLVENIAQTAAAMTGYEAVKKNESVKIGFIGAVKNLQIFHHPKVGSTLQTTVRVNNQVLNVSIIKGEVREGETLVAECEMKIFLEE